MSDLDEIDELRERLESWKSATGFTSPFDAKGLIQKQQQVIAEQLEQIAMLERDLLSGLYVRSVGQRMLERLPRAFPFGVLCFLDIDDMKTKHNDVGGMSEGDRAVRLASAAVVQELRAEDIGVRWAGDEIVIGMALRSLFPSAVMRGYAPSELSSFVETAQRAVNSFCERVLVALDELQKDEPAELPRVTVTCASAFYLSAKHRKPEDRKYKGSAWTLIPAMPLVDAVNQASQATKALKDRKKRKDAA